MNPHVATQQLKMKELKDSVAFHKEQGEAFSNQFKKVMVKCGKTHEKLMKELDSNKDDKLKKKCLMAVSIIGCLFS